MPILAVAASLRDLKAPTARTRPRRVARPHCLPLRPRRGSRFVATHGERQLPVDAAVGEKTEEDEGQGEARRSHQSVHDAAGSDIRVLYGPLELPLLDVKGVDRHSRRDEQAFSR
jgi:hypothetical protein